MSIRISVAAMIAEHMDGAHEAEVDVASVGEALHVLTARYPALAGLLWRGDGDALNPMLVVFANRRDIREQQGLATPLAPGDEVMLITAVEGG